MTIPVRQIASAFLILCCGCGATMATPAKGEASVSALIAQVRTAKHAVDRRRAASELERLGPQAKKAVPVLLRAMRSEREEVVRAQIVRTLGAIAPNDVTVIGAVASKLAERGYYNEVVKAAIDTLAKIGTPAIPIVIERLTLRPHPTDDEVDAAGAAADVLGKIGQPAIAGTILAAKDLRKRIGALKAMMPLGQQWPKEIVPQVVQYLDDRDSLVRQTAIHTISFIGPPAAEAVPALVRRLDDHDVLVCTAAAAALGRMGPAAAQAVPALIGALDRTWPPSQDTGAHRHAVVSTLAQIGPKADVALPRLERLWQETKDPQVEGAIARIRSTPRP